MVWFEQLTGFREQDFDDVAAQFDIDGQYITSLANGRRMRVGRFETPSLGELRGRMPPPSGEPTSVREVLGDVREFHAEPANAGAVFQVASQFNTLEMPSPTVTPESGIDAYEHDHTQGPACAVACGPGTIHRNYLVELSAGHNGPGGSEGRRDRRDRRDRGQCSGHQIDCLADMVARAGSSFDMSNGYALPSDGQLDVVCRHIAGLSVSGRDELAEALRIGMQWDTEVTLDNAGISVTQAYCSGVPISYSTHSTHDWEPLARLVLDAAYDSTLTAARINRSATGNPTVFLTLLGGGVFGNPTDWIVEAMARAIERHSAAGLDVAIVSYSRPNTAISDLLTRW